MTAPKKTTTRKSPATRAKKGPTPAKPVTATPGPGKPFEPFVIDTTQPIDEERETLFYIDDTEYTVPKRVRPNFAVRVLRDLARGGEEVNVIAGAVDSVIGTEAMDALANCDHVTDEQVAQIISLVGDRIRGATDGLTANF